MSKLRETIAKDGQAYIDEAVVAWPKPPDVLEHSLAAAFNRPLPERVVLGHERIKLRWLKRAPDGSLVPR